MLFRSVVPKDTWPDFFSVRRKGSHYKLQCYHSLHLSDHNAHHGQYVDWMGELLHRSKIDMSTASRLR